MAIKRPEGTKDLLPAEAQFWAHVRSIAFDLFARYGYVPLETPIFEKTDLFVRGIGEATDVVGKEMYTAISGGNLQKLLDGEHVRSDSRFSLRPEGTAGIRCRQTLCSCLAGRPAGLFYPCSAQEQSRLL